MTATQRASAIHVNLTCLRGLPFPDATIIQADQEFVAGFFALPIAVAAPVVITTTGLPAAISGLAYSQTIHASGGSGTYLFSVVSGTLPPGLSLSVGGVLAGTPALLGSIAPTTLPHVVSGAAYYQTLTLANTTASYSFTVRATDATDPTRWDEQSYSVGLSADPAIFSLFAGTLPPGLSLASDGVISGTVTIGEEALAIVPITLPLGTVDVLYQQQLIVSNLVVGSYTFTARATAHGLSPADQSYTLVIETWETAQLTVAPGSVLPRCLGLTRIGVLKGPPMTVGTFTFTIRATHPSGTILDQPYTFVVHS